MIMPQIYYTNLLYKHRVFRNLRLLIYLAILSLFIGGLSTKHVGATTPDQYPGYLKPIISAYNIGCPTSPNLYEHDTWISKAGDPSQTTVYNVNYYDTFVDLQFNESIFLCRSITNVDARAYASLPNDGTPKSTAKLQNNSTRINGASVVPSPLGNLSGLTPGIITDNNFNGSSRYWFTSPPVFRYNSTSPFTVNQTIDIHVSATQINTYSGPPSGPPTGCVNGGKPAGGSHNFSNCPPDNLVFPIQIVVGPPPPPPTTPVSGRIYDYNTGTGIVGANFSGCSGFPGAISGSSGYYTASVNIAGGGDFCIPKPSVPAGYDGPFIRPSGEAYGNAGFTGCGVFAPAPPPSTPSYCTQNSYANQKANTYTGNGYDRIADDGYDFVVTSIPPPACTNLSPTLSSGISAGSSIEPGVSYEVVGGFTNNSTLASMSNSDYTVLMTISNQSGSVFNNPVGFTPNPVGHGSQATFRSGFRSTDPVGDYTVQVNISGPNVNVTCPPVKYTVASKPYLRVYGGDVLAGASVYESDGTTCTQTITGGIYGNNAGALNGPGSGSGTQYAAQALGLITNFDTAITRPLTLVPLFPTPPTGLAFANTTPAGKFGDAPCAIDYFASYNSATPSTMPYLGTPGRQYYSGPGASPLDLTATTIAGGVRAALYVNGDVHIGGNITYGSPASLPSIPSPPWSLGQIPALWIIAKGNIYIDASVKRLDGVYIAQKDGAGNKGIIYTCSQGNIPFPLTANDDSATVNNQTFINACSNKLTINGAFIAQTVKFQRTKGTLKDSANLEPIISPTIAETFLYSPELWLIAPPTYTGNNSINYDSITGLPPIL